MKTLIKCFYVEKTDPDVIAAIESGLEELAAMDNMMLWVVENFIKNNTPTAGEKYDLVVISASDSYIKDSLKRTIVFLLSPKKD
jgi:hypothetical protein